MEFKKGDKVIATGNKKLIQDSVVGWCEEMDEYFDRVGVITAVDKIDDSCIVKFSDDKDFWYPISVLRREGSQLPKYWVVKNNDSAEFKQHVLGYLDRVHHQGWSGKDIGCFYGYDGGDLWNGTNIFRNVNSFVNNPTILSLEEFIKMTTEERSIKDELKTGMIVENKKGDLSKVLLNTERGDLIAGNLAEDGANNWCPLDSYNENLEYIGCDAPEADIVAIYSMNMSNADAASIKHKGVLFWERKVEKEKVTQKQLEELVGGQFEIIQDDI